MLISAIVPTVTSLVVAATKLNAKYARARRNALTVKHLQGLPDYLRQDVGLRDHASIADVVEHGLQPTEIGPSRPLGRECQACA